MLVKEQELKQQELQPFPPLVARQHPSQYIWPLPPLNKGRRQPSASPSEAPSREVLQEYPTETRILATSEKGTPAAGFQTWAKSLLTKMGSSKDATTTDSQKQLHCLLICLTFLRSAFPDYLALCLSTLLVVVGVVVCFTFISRSQRASCFFLP